jgi:acetylglutamate kinase
MNALNKTIHPIVIKYGGSLLEEAEHRARFMKQVAKVAKYEKVVLVHGGGKEITREMEKAGLETKFVGGRRYTDDPTMLFVLRVLLRLNGEIVKELEQTGTPARGLSGQEDHLLEGVAIPELGRVGYPRSVDQNALQLILSAPAMPVFYSVAEDIQGKPLNINADDFALALAVASRAKQLIYLTDSGGILGSDGKLIPYLAPKEVEMLIVEKVISGGMIVKSQACLRALQEGVGRVDIVKGIDYLLPPHNKSAEGTVFLPGPEVRN